MDNLYDRCKYYILAGFFPTTEDWLEVNRIRDIFNLLDGRSLRDFLTHEETADNAKKLFTILWSQVYVSDLLKD